MTFYEFIKISKIYLIKNILNILLILSKSPPEGR